MSFVQLVTDWAFYASADGRRLFAPYGIGFRPYVVPDQAMEDRLARRLAWTHPTVLAFFGFAMMVVAVRGVIQNDPWSFFDPANFFGLLVVGTGVMWVVVWVALRGLVRGHTRDSRPLSWRATTADLASRRSPGSLAFATAMTALITAFGLVVAVIRSSSVGLYLAMFGVFTMAHVAYALWLRSGTAELAD